MFALYVAGPSLFNFNVVLCFQFPVAVKTCHKCKHSFYLSKKDILPTPTAQVTTATTVSPAEEPKAILTTTTTRSDGRRRTERVRREKPNYYDASAFIRKTRVNINLF